MFDSKCMQLFPSRVSDHRGTYKDLSTQFLGQFQCTVALQTDKRLSVYFQLEGFFISFHFCMLVFSAM